MGGISDRLPLRVLFVGLSFWISLPMHGISRWRQQNENNNHNKKRKQKMYDWSFVRLPYRVFFLIFDDSSSSSSLRSESLTLNETSCLRGTNVPVSIGLNWGERDFSGSEEVLGLGERNLFCVSSLFLISGDVLVFQFS